MKKKLEKIFDEATPNELEQFSDALGAAEASDEELAAIKSKVYARLEIKKKKRAPAKVWLRAGMVAACVAVVWIGIFTFVTALRLPKLRISETLPLSSAPQRFYGSEDSLSANQEMYIKGPSVVAEFVDVLPDVYTMYQDWDQEEFILLHMKTIKLLRGCEDMPEEFYYIVPIEYTTDFSLYDRFVISGMGQCTYEYSVMYNKTQEKSEQLNLIVYSNNAYGIGMGSNFMAFDEDGNFDQRLWSSTDRWNQAAQNYAFPSTLKEVEEEEYLWWENEQFFKHDYRHSLESVSGDAAKALEYIKSFENGLFVPDISFHLHAAYPTVQFGATRYINGLASNERLYIRQDPSIAGNEATHEFTKARFDEEDLKVLPDLRSAISTVADAYERDKIRPPHIRNYKNLKLLDYGIFGWYAKTEDGVIGVVRVNWMYSSEKIGDGVRMDDAYYIIEYGSDICKPIERDELLEKLGEYEATYIYTGDYNEKGKIENYVED